MVIIIINYYQWICFVCQSKEAPCWINCISVSSVITLTKLAQQEVRSERLNEPEHRSERIMEMEPRKTQRALDLAAEKGSSAWWLTVLPLQDLGFNLNKREFRDAVKQRYYWPVQDIPSTCARGETFTVEQSMICKLGGFITQRHNELRDLEAEFLSMVCSDVDIEPVLQDTSGESLNRGSNKAQDVRLDIHARGFWERHRSAFFDVRVCHPVALSYRDREPQQSYRIHDVKKHDVKKRLYSRRVLYIENGKSTSLVFTTTGGMGKECLKYHSRSAQLVAIKKGEQYAKTISWIRTRTSFALLRYPLVCFRGSRTRRVACDIKINVDIDVEVVEGAIQ